MNFGFKNMMETLKPEKKIEVILDMNDSVFKKLTTKVLVDFREELGEDAVEKVSDILNNDNMEPEARVALYIELLEKKLTKEKVDSLIEEITKQEKDIYSSLLE